MSIQIPEDNGLSTLHCRSKASDAVRIGLETGPTSTWKSYRAQLGLRVICIDARHAMAVQNMQIKKSDRNDAIGIARIMQTGWFKEGARQGYRQSLGQGASGQPGAAVRAEELIEGRPELVAAVTPLLEARTKDIELGTADGKTKVLQHGFMANGQVNRIKRPNTWLQRPMLQNREGSSCQTGAAHT